MYAQTMPVGPQPIETTYNGVTFRSRLEARWVVFFDALKVRWEYEHEGYELPSGRYLPDFWLPNTSGGVFVEVKPPRALTPREAAAVYELVALTGNAALVARGSPDETHHLTWSGRYDEPWPDGDEIESALTLRTRRRRHASLGFGVCSRCSDPVLVGYSNDPVGHEFCTGAEVVMPPFRLDKAIDASRVKRFWQ